MKKQTSSLVSYSVCGKRKSGEIGLSSRVSTKVVDDETWTTFYYSDNDSMFWWKDRRNDRNPPVPSFLSKNSAKPAVYVEKNPAAKRLRKDGINRGFKNSMIAFIEKFQPFQFSVGSVVLQEKNSTDEIRITAPVNSTTIVTGTEFRKKVHKVNSWCNKSTRKHVDFSTLQEETNGRRAPKKHRIRKWLNKESPGVISVQRVKKAQHDFSVAAAEAAIVAEVRDRAKKTAKAGAFTAAAFACVIAEERSPNASHGSIAEIISKACKDVSSASLVQRAENGDYLRLHQLFHYHYKFRGPNYYSPLEPCCYYILKSDGKAIIHCKMNEPIETFRSSAIAKNSPLVLFLKQITEESGAKAQTNVVNNNSNVDFNMQTKFRDEVPGVPVEIEEDAFPSAVEAQNLKHHHGQPSDKFTDLDGSSEVSTTVKVQSDDCFRVKSGDIGRNVSSQVVPLKSTLNRQKDEKNHNCNVGDVSTLTSIKHFLETLDFPPAFDENVSSEIEREGTVPRLATKSIWEGKRIFEPASQFRVSSQYLSMRTSSVGMVR